MIPSEAWKNLILGSGSSWRDPSSILRRQWYRILGQYRHLGIELEMTHVYVAGRLPELHYADTYVERIQHLYGKPHPYDVKATNSQELGVLWDVTDPVRFVADVRRFVNALARVGMPTAGSVHINVQVPSDRQGYRIGNIHADILHADCAIQTPFGEHRLMRVENKFGPIFIGPEELICGLIIGASLTMRSYNLEEPLKSLLILASRLQQVVPKALLTPEAYLTQILNQFGNRVSSLQNQKNGCARAGHPRDSACTSTIA
jgi:hypothetical protein